MMREDAKHEDNPSDAERQSVLTAHCSSHSVVSPPDFPPSDPNQMTEQEKLSLGSRWLELARFLGAAPQAATMYMRKEKVDFSSSSQVNYEQQIGNYVGYGSGLLIALVFHLFFKERYEKSDSQNPLYRMFKTMASFGSSIGMSVTKMLPISTGAQNFFGVIIADFFSIGFGFFALPFWYARESYRKKYPLVVKNPKEKEDKSLAVTGTEGWTKYAKTLLVYGASLGQVIGAFYGHFTGGNLLASMAIVGGITSVACFVGGICVVPLVNKFCKNIFKSSDKDKFRNNYVRAGVTLGLALGTTIGFVIGTFLCPGLGSTAGMVLGAAIGSLASGTAIGVFGHRISSYVQRNWNIKKDTENAWDYAARNTSYLFAFLGSAIGFFVPVPGGALMGAAIGGAIGGLFGWGAGIGVVRAARKMNPHEEEQKSTTLPWTMRIAASANVGSIIGGGIGFVLGFMGGPAGVMAGAALGFAIGGFVAGMFGGLYGMYKDRKMKQLAEQKRLLTVVERPRVPELSTSTANVNLLLKNEVKFELPIPTPSPSPSPAPLLVDEVDPLRAMVSSPQDKQVQFEVAKPVLDYAPLLENANDDMSRATESKMGLLSSKSYPVMVVPSSSSTKEPVPVVTTLFNQKRRISSRRLTCANIADALANQNRSDEEIKILQGISTKQDLSVYSPANATTFFARKEGVAVAPRRHSVCFVGDRRAAVRQ